MEIDPPVAAEFETRPTTVFSVEVLVLIVGFRNAREISECLAALPQSAGKTRFSVLLIENGGKAAFDALLSDLAASSGPCAGVAALLPPSTSDPTWPPEGIAEVFRLQLGECAEVLVGRATENLGYAGAINAWLRPALANGTWRGAWILNPDTVPQGAALQELVAYAGHSRKGMVGSRIMRPHTPHIVCSRGLKWRKVMASTLGVGINEPVDPAPDANAVESRLDSPPGASFFVTRECIEQIGLMDESYFLYFEDLEWGTRARDRLGIGYAYNSVVFHTGGTTIGSSYDRRRRSKVAVYYEFRNRILFVRRNVPGWLAWTVLMTTLHSFEFLVVGAFDNFWTALRAVAAGVRGETGRADALFPHLATSD